MLLIETANTKWRAPLLQQALAIGLHIAGASMEVSASKVATRRYPLQCRRLGYRCSYKLEFTLSCYIYSSLCGV